MNTSHVDTILTAEEAYAVHGAVVEVLREHRRGLVPTWIDALDRAKNKLHAIANTPSVVHVVMSEATQPKFKGVVLAYDEVETVVEFATRGEADSYERGLIEGAVLFGGGNVRLILQADWQSLDEGDRAIVRAHIGEPTVGTP